MQCHAVTEVVYPIGKTKVKERKDHLLLLIISGGDNQEIYWSNKIPIFLIILACTALC